MFFNLSHFEMFKCKNLEIQGTKSNPRAQNLLTSATRIQNAELCSDLHPQAILTHTEKVGKKQLLLSCQISPLFWHRKFHKPEI
jgi:hypothetical protein